MTDTSTYWKTNGSWGAGGEWAHVLVQYASDIIAVLEADCTVRYVNPAVERTLGFKPEELVGSRGFDHIHPEDAKMVLGVFAGHRVKSGFYPPVELRVRDREGRWHYFEAVATNLLGDPALRGIVISARDITDRKLAQEQLRQSEELYRTVVEQVAENILLVDLDGKRILQSNAALGSTLGYTEKELQQMELYNIIAHDRESVDLNIRKTMEKGRHFVGERKYRRKDGSLVDVEVSASVISYGEKRAMCMVAHDITERKQAEDELRDALSMLLALREAGQVLGSSLEREKISLRLLEIMRRVSNLTTAAISVQDEGEDLHIWRSVGVEDLWPKARFSPEAENARRAVLRGEGRRIFRLSSPDLGRQALTGLCLPLKTQNDTLGVLEAYGPEWLAESDVLEVLGSLANQAAKALENARLYRELSEREHRLQDLVGRLLGAQEEERRRVAYEIHDGLAQISSAACQRLQVFARRYSPESKKGREDLDRILELVRRTVSEARRIVANLRPRVLDDLGLAAALAMEVERLHDDGYQVTYEEELGEKRLPDMVEIALYRVAQEAMTNACKHSRAKQISIELRRRESYVHLEVRDHGRGFDPAGSHFGGGPGQRVGIAGMRERVNLLDGKLTINSRPGAGTTVIVDLPLAGHEEGEEHEG